MNNIVKIFTVLMLAALVSSCAKDELEAPSQSSEEKASEVVVIQDANGILEVESVGSPNTGTPASINDDGDDEDEDRTLLTTEETSTLD